MKSVILGEECLRTSDFEKIYPIHRNTLYKWLRANVIRGFLIKGIWFIPKSEIERLKLQAKANGNEQH